MKSEFKIANEDIAKALSEVKYDGDASDIGNEIGIILGKYIEENKMGWELDSFISGIKHGISITDGTHTN
jgi:hypothetical protein